MVGCLTWMVLGRPNGRRRRLYRRIRGAPPPAKREAAGPAAPETRDAPPDVAPEASGPTLPDDALEHGASADFPVGVPVEIVHRGVPVAVIRTESAWYALGGACPHAEGALADGTVSGATLTCPGHGWSFDLPTGRCLVDPAKHAACYTAIERDGRLWIASPDRKS